MTGLQPRERILPPSKGQNQGRNIKPIENQRKHRKPAARVETKHRQRQKPRNPSPTWAGPVRARPNWMGLRANLGHHTDENHRPPIINADSYGAGLYSPPLAAKPSPAWESRTSCAKSSRQRSARSSDKRTAGLQQNPIKAYACSEERYPNADLYLAVWERLLAKLDHRPIRTGQA